MGLTTVLVALGLAMTTAHAEPASDAAQLLSRFPAGAVPDAPPVHAAIDLLAAHDDGESLALLSSLRRHEAGAVADHARDAEAVVAARALSSMRTTAAHSAPTDRDVRTWVGAHQHDAAGIPASELRVVAYAALVTHNAHWSTDAIGSLTPDESARVVAEAEQLELDDRPGAALPLLVDAAMSGDARATHALMARGVDVDRLALGLSSEFATTRGLPRLHQAPVVQTSDPAAVTVLLTRAESGGALPRLAAIENLGVLLRTGNLDAAWQKRARDTLVRASTDLRPVVRRTAENALALNP